MLLLGRVKADKRSFLSIARNQLHNVQWNLAEYEGFLEVEESTIVELTALVEALIADVDRLIKT